MATAVFGSVKRGAPRRFYGRIRPKGVLGQSPLPEKTPNAASITSPDIAGVPDADRAPADCGSEHHAGALSAQESDENVTFTALLVITVSSILLAAK